jgi:hypothetical protein
MRQIFLVLGIALALVGCEEEKKPAPVATAAAPVETKPPPPKTEAPAETAAPSASADSDAAAADRAKLAKDKNDLKAKVAAGKATEADKKMLKALCRELGDIGCAH